MDWKKEAKLFLLFLNELELTLDLSLRLLLLLLLLRNLAKRLLVLSEDLMRPKNPGLALKLLREAVLQSNCDVRLPNIGPRGSSSGSNKVADNAGAPMLCSIEAWNDFTLVLDPPDERLRMTGESE